MHSLRSRGIRDLRSNVVHTVSKHHSVFLIIGAPLRKYSHGQMPNMLQRHKGRVCSRNTAFTNKVIRARDCRARCHAE